jgi:Ran-interacting Mog1 protein
MMSTMENKELFGGAIACRLPIDSVDLSDIREVPSHQECWFVETDQRASIAFTVEILRRQDDVADDRIAEVLFRDLADANGASAAALLPSSSSSSSSSSPTALESYPVALPHLPGIIGQRATGELTMAAPAGGGVSTQSSSHGPMLSPNLHLLNTHQNNQHPQSILSSSPPEMIVEVEIGVIRLPAQTTDILLTIMVPQRVLLDRNASNSTDRPARRWMDEMMASFRVQDWGLFGTE